MKTNTKKTTATAAKREVVTYWTACKYGDEKDPLTGSNLLNSQEEAEDQAESIQGHVLEVTLEVVGKKIVNSYVDAAYGFVVTGPGGQGVRFGCSATGITKGDALREYNSYQDDMGEEPFGYGEEEMYGCTKALFMELFLEGDEENSDEADKRRLKVPTMLVQNGGETVLDLAVRKN